MNMEEENRVLDVAGEKLKIGDIVYRAAISSLSIHRVVRFTKVNVVLSVQIEEQRADYTRSGITQYRILRKDMGNLPSQLGEMTVRKSSAPYTLIKKQNHGDPRDFIQIGQQVQTEST